MKVKLKRNEHGNALLMVLMVVVVFTILGAGLLTMNVSASKQFDKKEEQVWDVDGIFLYLGGMMPGTDFLNGAVMRDEEGYVMVDEYLRTNVDGVFAGGDARRTRSRKSQTPAEHGLADWNWDRRGNCGLDRWASRSRSEMGRLAAQISDVDGRSLAERFRLMQDLRWLNHSSSHPEPRLEYVCSFGPDERTVSRRRRR